MPLYDYNCENCGDFRSWQRMSESNADMPCPECDQMAVRLVAAPALALMANNNRVAHASNEKSADQPEMITRTSGGQDDNAHRAHVHGSHCHAGHEKSGHHTHSHSHGRPWMIGH
ncbi:MAG: FmdB family zinc ribbon protein [Geminicoccaceae bacterium]